MAPRAEIKEEKKDKVHALASTMKSAQSLVFVDYAGMSVGVAGELRERLREAEGGMIVAKNTLMKLAMVEAGVETSDEISIFEGQTAMIYGESDAVSPVQALGKFVKEKELPKVKAGLIEGNFYDHEGVIKISKLPPREELYAQVVGGVASGLYALVGTLQGNLQKLVFVLEQYRQKQA